MHFEQLSVHECKDKLTQASSLGKHLWSQYLRAGKGYGQMHVPFPPSSEAECLHHWEKLGGALPLSSHSICALIFLFRFCVLLLAGCSGTRYTYRSRLGRHLPAISPDRAWSCSPTLFLRRSKIKLFWAIKILTLLSSRAARSLRGNMHQ